jgi:small-conductance mechanosensitive channel
MNSFNLTRKAVASPLVLSLALGWLAGGCVSPSADSSAPKPGQGIAEYREVTREARGRVAAMVDAVEALAQSSGSSSKLSGFDRALHQLEVTSVKTRARADAIIVRGQAYFDEWKENLAATTNQATARAATERYGRMLEQFERVRECSKEVREKFRPFMAKLREFRARLDQPAAAGAELSRPELETLAASGRSVLTRLDAVSTALNEAQAALQATLARTP